jgi:hypothetical protein
MPDMVKFTREKLDALESAYQKAVDEGAEDFMFEGHEWLTDYAKYAIEFLNTKIRRASNE